MNQNTFLFTLLLFINFFSSYSQSDDLLIANTIPLELRANANGVVRYNNIHIQFEAYNKMIFTNKRIVTILNKEGNHYDRSRMRYDENTVIKNMVSRIYDADGNEIKKIKKNDFKDVSVVDGVSLYTDNRLKYLDYTPISYPYTVVFETEVHYKSTAFIRSWIPIEGFYTSTQNAEYKITNNSGVEIKIKTKNFENYTIERISDFHYKAKNLKAISREAYSPAFVTYAPSLKAALTEFDMEGVKGVNTNWEDFGRWMNDELLSDTQELPELVKEEIKTLTSNAKTNIEKAKIVYDYLQNKTRYISVQVGIGGWKPMMASDVDNLGYGDCKALTNYTKALLDEVNVPSYYTIIYGDRDITSIDADFSATQGNHAILCIPNNDDYVWLECTSQTYPFGYNANFTDDRDALVITPEGGKIVHTKIYNTEDNLLETRAKIELNVSGDISGNVIIKSYGTQYGYHQDVESDILKDQVLHYKEYWDNINNLEVESIDLVNDKDSIVFTENVKISATRYASKAGDRLLLQPNMFNHAPKAPPRYKNRKLPFEIERGFVDVDEFLIKLPEQIVVDALQEHVSISNKFGSYSFSITQQEDNSLVFKRKFQLNKGSYDKENYTAFRDFWLQVVKHDKSKIALKTN